MLTTTPAVRLKALGFQACPGRLLRPGAFAYLHTTPSRPSSPTAPQLPLQSPLAEPKTPLETAGPAAGALDDVPQVPLSVLPLSAVLRSYMVTSISSSHLLLPPSLAVTSWIANSQGPLLNPDRNPLLHYVLKKTFYAHFCAGETPEETRQTIARLKGIGLSGVILGYAKEVVLEESETGSLASSQSNAATKQEIAAWMEGTLATVEIAAPGDFVAMKFTGAGRQALQHLAERKPPSTAMAEAIDRVCQLAVSRGVRLLFDAEQFSLQAGIDDWTLACMRRYNAGAAHAAIYGTYQAYLKSTPATLSQHLRAARDGGFALGIKLVRGAYIDSDPRHLIHDTKADTDAAYDGIVDAVLHRTWQAPLALAEKDEAFPRVSLVVASHNATSVRKARALVESGATDVDVAFGQLQGMADEVSCELVVGQKSNVPDNARVKAYKYLVWGSTSECMKYLLRRAHENRDAVQRTRDGRTAMQAELWRRLKGVFA